MIKVSIWSPEKAEKEIHKRFQNASNARNSLEDRWTRNEQSLYAISSPSLLLGGESGNMLDTEFLAGNEYSEFDMNVAYVFKNFRYIHAQMSANPPSVAMRPTSSDEADRRKADAADRLVRWAMRAYSMQENHDQMNLQALGYGTGFMKTVWDSTLGDIISYDPETECVELEGDISVSVPFVRNVFLDPDAKKWPDVKWVIEKIYMDYDEARARWPGEEEEEILKQARITNETHQTGSTNSLLETDHYNSVELLEYWETGLPSNGYLGRYCITSLSGKVLEKPRPNPFRFTQAGAVYRIENDPSLTDVEKEAAIAKLPEKAQLPYHILTDIDIPNTIWGRSAVEYAAPLQENLSRMDTARIDNMQAHATPRMVLPDDAEITEEGFGNSTWEVTKVKNMGENPYYCKPPEVYPDQSPMRSDIKEGINDVMGVNESMFGQQSREQAAAAMQYATNQGNMVRRRLFNKYTLTVESVYKAILNLIRKHWTVERTIHVLGNEQALEAIDIKGADIDGGYDVIGEYGTTLSLDPVTRREEIITLQPILEKAGLNPKSLVKHLKLNELEGIIDSFQKAGLRQKEIFDLMIAKKIYIDPKPFRDHENMIAWALEYFMSSEFEALPLEVQQLCEKHIHDRSKLAALEKSGQVPPPGTPISEALNQPPTQQPLPPEAGAVPAPVAAAPAPTEPAPVPLAAV
jgi:hypothetical protein